jgi:hypothetical protein
MRSHVVYAHKDTGCECRMPNQSGDGAFRKSRTSGWLDTFPVPRYESDLPEQVAPGHGRIRGGHRISAGHNRGIVRPLGYDAVNKEAAISDEEDNVAFGDVVAGDVINHERVPGHHRGQHAPARDAQAQRAGGPQYPARQFALQRVSIPQ